MDDRPQQEPSVQVDFGLFDYEFNFLVVVIETSFAVVAASDISTMSAVLADGIVGNSIRAVDALGASTSSLSGKSCGPYDMKTPTGRSGGERECPGR
jgi:hypothetical protein